MAARGTYEASRPLHDPIPPAFVELFVDVVYILAFFILAQGLSANLNWRGALQTAVLLLAVMWIWILSSWLTDLYDPQRPQIKALVIEVMFGSLLAAIALPAAFGRLSALFVGAYVATIGVTSVALIVLAPHASATLRTEHTLFWHGVTSVGWIAGALTHGTGRLVLWGVAAVTSYAASLVGWPTPGLGRIRLDDRIFNAWHLFERHRQIFLVSIGELILSIGLGFARAQLGVGRVIGYAVVFANTVLILEIYFSRARQLLASDTLVTLERVRSALATSSAHLLMVGGVVMISAADDLITADPFARRQVSWTVIIVGGPVVVMLGSLLFDTVIGSLRAPRVIATAVLVAVAPTLYFVPPLVAAALTNLVLAGCLATEAAFRWRRTRSRTAAT
ncbi:hypothetical protein GCM10023322_25440 [Rugosimonospora acidiphila]|uniref:Low temperature requirement protein LtrA n=1 Tax=Rugosimonospora acidiphila TaxID=556531 RepID=A0ABP9RRA8_9ACTN